VNPEKGGIEPKMRRLLKSKKALSPVVAAIILIAVTVAVSIAVAAWMGALTFTFMQTEQFNVVSATFNGNTTNPTNTITLKIQNTGSSSFTIDTAAKVNGVSKTLAGQVTVEAGSSKDVTIPDVNWSDGNQYNMELLTTQGTKITWVANAPGT
jgi:flagellin-like protein